MRSHKNGINLSICHGILILFATSFVPSFAQTNSITVQTDNNMYEMGDTIAVSGTVTTIVGGTPVSFEIRNSSSSLVALSQISVEMDGSYLHTVIVEGQLSTVGEYMVMVTYDGATAETSFSVGESPTQEIQDILFSVQQSTNLLEQAWSDTTTFTITVTNPPGTIFYRLTATNLPPTAARMVTGVPN